MSDNTKIEWTDATWNPITGCSVVSPGCTNCYAMHLAGTRLKNHPSRAGLTRHSAGRHVWNGQIRWNDEWLEQPLKWAKRLIFVCAHSDLFHAEVERWMIVEVFGVMIAGHHLRGHTYQVLTKRAERMVLLLTNPDFWEEVMDAASSYVMDHVDPLNRRSEDARATMRNYDASNPPPFIWLGVSVEDQRRADERIHQLLRTPAAVRWLSCEPLLGAVDLGRLNSESWDYGCGTKSIDALAGEGVGRTPGVADSRMRWCDRGIDWVVVGGESGTNARPMHPDWARALRDQCAAAGVPYFFKQWGEWLPAGQQASNPLPLMTREDTEQQTATGKFRVVDGQPYWCIGKKAAGRLLDGVEHNAYPVTP